MKEVSTEIKAYLTYENLFTYIKKGDLYLPVSYLSDADNIESLIDDLIKDVDSIEGINYSSFLNAITQTCDIDKTEELGIKELKHTRLINKPSPLTGLLVHRDNLLYLVAKLILKAGQGKQNITGPNNNAKDYYKALLLASSKLNNTIVGNKKHIVLKDIFIREYPYSYLPDLTQAIYSNRICRYKYIYSELLKGITSQNLIHQGIALVEKKLGISLQDYFYILEGILCWFFLPFLREKYAKNEYHQNLGFDYTALNTFYINRDNFKGNPALISLIEHLSADINELRQHLLTVKKDKVSGCYKYFQHIFDKPVFKIDKDNYCIMDLKFLFEGICSGLLWRLKEIGQAKFQDMKSDYGYLLEGYFRFLLGKVFGSNISFTNKQPGQPDTIVNVDGYTIVFEFTTEHYRFASLYDSGTEGFRDDLHKILFNQGKADSRGRGKKDEGKFLKLDKYVGAWRKTAKKILPVLVTENYLGDYALLNEFDPQGFLDKKIAEGDLNDLKKYKPLIINLDDLETFWALSIPSYSGHEFIRMVEDWDKESQKGKFHYNISSYMTTQGNKLIKNDEYKNFFHLKNNGEKEALGRH